MKKQVNQISVIELQERVENLHVVLREHKEDRNLTNQDVSEEVKVPLDRARKFFAGELKNPSVYGVMAVCMLFGLSLDSLLGNPYGKAGGHDAEIARLQNENAILNIKLENALRLLQRVEKVLGRTTIGVFVLLTMCAILVLTLAAYFINDLKNHSVGFVRDDAVSPVIFVVGGVLIAAVIIMALLLVRVMRNKKENENHRD